MSLDHTIALQPGQQEQKTLSQKPKKKVKKIIDAGEIVEKKDGLYIADWSVN